ncbi:MULTISPECIES: hypothetical protein [unclassified Sinorhizobium]|uniref:hypothetical protein n=1 Tax=unclassified Sinorhizobium TaxID=2613772 RepID=UPI0035234114
MSDVSSVSNSSYAFRGTLTRLDTNGDGVLSRGELAAEERPGIIRETSDGNDDSSRSVEGGLVAMLLEIRDNGTVQTTASQPLPLKQLAPGIIVSGTVGDGATPSGQSMQVANDLYRNTYGQYEPQQTIAANG